MSIFSFVKIWLYALLMITKKIQIFLGWAWSFVHLNNQVICEWYWEAITPNKVFCKVFEIWQPVYMTQQFLFYYKMIYKCKLVNFSPGEPYVFIHPAKILFTPRGLYRPHWEALL